MTGYTDPPGMPEDERMTPAELRVVREFLGLTGDALAAYLDVSGRTVRHWEQGKYLIPDGVRLALEDLEAKTGTFVTNAINALLDMPEPGVITYRSDDEYHAAHPEMTLPASWHRAVIARVAQEVHGLSIAYPQEPTMVATTYVLAYETPGDGEDAWVTRTNRDGDISHPLDVNDEVGPDDSAAAQRWAAEKFTGMGVTVNGWNRVPGMEWPTWHAETD